MRQPPNGLAELFDEIAAQRDCDVPRGLEIGRSRENRPIAAYRFGDGDIKISLIAGCHADEPVGPRLLTRLVAYLDRLPPSAGTLSRYDWWIVPHINPDGAARNRVWQEDIADGYDLTSYLKHVVREQPGDDIEFGFPRNPGDDGARPENRAVHDWWMSGTDPFLLHASLHGMAFGGGPWFLIDPKWVDRCSIIKDRCGEAARRLGYPLHDAERRGEKGFERIERGFCTRPNSAAMARYFIERNQPDTAARFRPSSMEAIRSHGGDPLTLVSEIPLFIVPGVGDTIEPHDPIAEAWRDHVASWKERLSAGRPDETPGDDVAHANVTPIPVRDQMFLQWTFVAAGIEQAIVAGAR